MGSGGALGGNHYGSSEPERLDAFTRDDRPGREVDRHPGVGHQPPQVGTRVDVDDAPQDAPAPYRRGGVLDDHDLLVREAGGQPRHHRRGRRHLGCAHPVGEHEKVPGEAEPVVAMCRCQRVDRHVQPDEVRCPVCGRPGEAQGSERARRHAGIRGHDRVDQMAGRMEVEQVEDGGVGFVDHDGGLRREPARPDRVGGSRPRALGAQPRPDEIEGTVRLGGTGGSRYEDRHRARPRHRARQGAGDERQLGARPLPGPAEEQRRPIGAGFAHWGPEAAADGEGRTASPGPGADSVRRRVSSSPKMVMASLTTTF